MQRKSRGNDPETDNGYKSRLDEDEVGVGEFEYESEFESEFESEMEGEEYEKQFQEIKLGVLDSVMGNESETRVLCGVNDILQSKTSIQKAIAVAPVARACCLCHLSLCFLLLMSL